MFDFTSENAQEIRSSVRKLALSEIPKYQNANFLNKVPRQLLTSFSDLGLCGLAISGDFGGTPLSATEIAMVLEEVSAVDCGAAIFLSVHGLSSGIVQKFATTPLKKLALPKLASGAWLGAFALTEPGAGSDAAAIKTSAKRVGPEYVINGEKCYITSAGFADLYTIFARSDEGISAFAVTRDLIDQQPESFKIANPEHKMGGELSPIASISISNFKVPVDNLLGELGGGYRVALAGLAQGRINIGACALGISRTAIELSIHHLKNRKQFGQELVNFQGLQFMLADMQMKLEASRLLVYNAASSLDRDPGSINNRLYPSYAKCFASDSAMAITTDAVQLLGGAGYIKDYKVERLMRDAKMLQIVEGTNQIQRGIIAKQIIG